VVIIVKIIIAGATLNKCSTVIAVCPNGYGGLLTLILDEAPLFTTKK